MFSSTLTRLFFTGLLAAASTSMIGCGDEDSDPPPTEEIIETEQSELEAIPICQDITETETDRVPCGLKMNSEGEYVTVYKTCTQTCTTRRRIEFDGQRIICVEGMTICSQWICEQCPL